VNLTECPAEILGVLPRSRGPLARWGAEDLASWAKVTVAGQVRLTGPPVPDQAAASTRLLLVLTPGGATEIHVAPFVRASQSDVEQRKTRTIIVGLERDAAADEPVAVEVDLTEVVRGNWGDAVARRRLIDHFEITLPGAEESRVVLRELVLEDEMRPYEEAVAAVRQTEAAGLLRPAWFVHPGGSVRIRVQVPREAPEMRWHDAALGEIPARLVRIIEGGEARELWRSGPARGGWQIQRLDLAPWAGRGITLELAVEGSPPLGSGVGFFGDPRLLDTRDLEPAGIVLYLVDALRADAVGMRDSAGVSLTPTLDNLAASGASAAHAISTSAWTKPAIPTLLTGIPPTTHLVGAASYSDRLPETVSTIQRRFREAGWRTGSFSASPLGSTLSGLDRGFSAAAPPRRWAGQVGAVLHPGAGQIHDELLAWVNEEPEQPFFAYVHTLEVRSYPSGVFRKESGTVAEAYLRAVSDADRLLGGLMDRLRAAGQDRGLLIAVVADHGESLGEHGRIGHGNGLYQSVIHIPMILSGPALRAIPGGTPGLVLEGPVSLADLAPTLVSLAGLPRLEESAGLSFAGWLAGGEEGRSVSVRRFVTASLLRYVHNPDAPKQHALITTDLRKILRVEGQEDLFFDLGDDPREEKPLTTRDARLVKLLDAWLEDQRRAAGEFRRLHGGAVQRALDAEESERLRSLGYLE